jgi:hypothetical protein
MKTLLIAALTLPLAAAANPPDTRSVADALAAARREHMPLFVDFQAQWCYSCYYMASHVLNGPQWVAAGKRMHAIEVDADSPDGAAWMKKLAVKALPSYVVLDTDGSELGRITAEQPREKFYPSLERILGGKDSLAALKAKGTPGAIAQALTVYEARNEIEAGLDWYAALPHVQREAAAADKEAVFRLARLEMQKAAKGKDVATCVAAGERALRGGGGCDRVYVLEQMIDCAGTLPASERKSLLDAQRAALDASREKQFFADPPQCADQRTAVLVSADLAKAVADTHAEQSVLDQAIGNARARLGNDFARDRNLADNLRVYLTRAERTDELDTLYPKLIAAYPDDYVYAYRFGASLLKRGNAAGALPYLEQAAQKTFGANRLLVAQMRVKALLALGRRADAEHVAAEALDANGPWFPEQAEQLRATLKS